MRFLQHTLVLLLATGCGASKNAPSLDGAQPDPSLDWAASDANPVPGDADDPRSSRDGAPADLGPREADGGPDAGPGGTWSGPRSRVLFRAGEALIEMDGLTHRPIFLGLNSIHMTTQMWLDFEYQVRLAKQAGVPIVLVTMGWNTVTDPAGRKELFDRLERLDVKVMVRFSLDALTTKIMAHQTARGPLETAFFENLAGDRVGMIQHQQCDPSDLSCTDPQTIYRPAVDQGWIDSIWIEIRALLEDLDRSYPGRVMGLQLAHLTTGEWFLRWSDRVYSLPGSAQDPYFGWYEPGIRASFCAYLTREAPGLACALPSVATRHVGSYGTLLLDDSNDDSRRSVLFNRFVSLRITDAISQLAARAKMLTAGRLFVSAFYGYLFELNRSHSNLAASGHLALAELLADPNIDAITSPYSYGPSRSLGVALEPHGPVDSARLHNKLWIHEDDTRTHLAEPAERRVANLAGSRALVQRNGLTSLLHQNGLYYFDLWTAGWFGQDRSAETRADSSALWQTIGGLMQTMASLDTSGPRALEPQVAIFVDQLSAARHPIATVTHRPYLEGIYRDPVIHGSRVMAPVRYYLLSDLARPNFPHESVRLAIFANAFDVSPALRQTIASKLHKAGKVLFYLHAAGVMRGGGSASSTHIGELVGFDVQRGAGARITTSTFSDSVWTWLPRASFGLATAIDPWFFVPTGQSGVEVVARDSEQHITVARKDFGTHRVLYAATPGAPRDLYRTAAAWAGVHQVSDSVDDVVEARGNLLMLHSGGAGKRRVKLPFVTSGLYLEIAASVPLPAPILLCGPCDQTELDAPFLGATYLLRWE